MPSPPSIVDGLRLAANGAIGVAIAWHILTCAAARALLARWRPSHRMAGALLAGPIASASVIALAYDNPFNVWLLGVLALALVGSASRLDAHRVRRGGAASTLLGLVMIGFGWLYPHFLETRPATTYLFGAATGVLPCPTIALVIGFALLAGGLGSMVWSLMLGAVGLFYGLFGVLRLGVRLDIVLVGGSLALLWLGFGLWRATHPHGLTRSHDVRSIHTSPQLPPPIR